MVLSCWSGDHSSHCTNNVELSARKPPGPHGVRERASGKMRLSQKVSPSGEINAPRSSRSFQHGRQNGRTKKGCVEETTFGLKRCGGGGEKGKDILRARIRMGEDGTEAGKREGPVARPVVCSEHILTTSHSKTHFTL